MVPISKCSQVTYRNPRQYWHYRSQSNSTARCRDKSSYTVRHNEERETPFPQYLGILIHTKTCKRELMNALFKLGLCISCERVMTISTILNNNLCHQFETEKVMCPPKLRKNILVNAAFNNIDHNLVLPLPRTLSMGLVYLYSSTPNVKQVDWTEPPWCLSQTATIKVLRRLPKSYTDIPPVILCKFFQRLKDPTNQIVFSYQKPWRKNTGIGVHVD